MKLYIRHNNQERFVSDITEEDIFKVRDVSVIFGVKVQVGEKYITVDCRYNPKESIFFFVKE